MNHPPLATKTPVSKEFSFQREKNWALCGSNCKTQDERKNIGTASVTVGLHMSYDMFRRAFLALKPMSLHKMCNLMAKINAYLQPSTAFLNIRLFHNVL